MLRCFCCWRCGDHFCSRKIALYSWTQTSDIIVIAIFAILILGVRQKCSFNFFLFFVRQNVSLILDVWSVPTPGTTMSLQTSTPRWDDWDIDYISDKYTDNISEKCTHVTWLKSTPRWLDWDTVCLASLVMIFEHIHWILPRLGWVKRERLRCVRLVFWWMKRSRLLSTQVPWKWDFSWKLSQRWTCAP